MSLIYFLNDKRTFIKDTKYITVFVGVEAKYDRKDASVTTVINRYKCYNCNIGDNCDKFDGQ